MMPNKIIHNIKSANISLQTGQRVLSVRLKYNIQIYKKEG
jgi:hypothetical protein